MATYIESLKLHVPETYALKTFKKSSKTLIDEWYFRLHYKTTARLLILFTAIISVDQFIEKSILCDTSEHSLLHPQHNSLNFRREFIETYCFIQTTFIIPSYFNMSDPEDDDSNSNNNIKLLGMEEVLNRLNQADLKSEIKNMPESNTNYPDTIHYAYYQWVPFFLFFQAILFYTPHYIWKNIENHKIQQLLQTIHTKNLAKNSIQQTKQIDLLGKYIWICKDRTAHYTWTISYMLCEFLNLIILIGNIHLTNVFVGYEFTSYGLNVILTLIQKDPERRTDPMSLVFPRITKCTFMFFGPSQTIQTADTICFLTMNLINEKIFVFLWVWYILLLFITTIGLVFRIATIISTRFRIYNFGLSMPTTANGRNSLEENLTASDAHRNATLVQKLNIFDWILLRFIQLNVIDDRTFQLVLSRVNFHRLVQNDQRLDTKLIR